jgi:hypothetical protein
MDLLIKKFPDDLVTKLKIKALKMNVTLKNLVIQILLKEISQKQTKE